MREKEVERYLVEEVERAGGKALKFTSPGHAGVPDRLVLLPEGKCVFVEVKAPGKKMRPLQVKMAEQIQALGFPVACVDSEEAVKDVVFFAKDKWRRTFLFGYGWKGDS